MKIDFFKRCDNFRASDIVPIHCILQLDMGLAMEACSVTVIVSGSNSASDWSKTVTYKLTAPKKEYQMRMPFPYSHEPSQYEVSFEFRDRNGKVLQTVDRQTVMTSGTDRICIDSDYTQDSIYARMLLDSDNIISLSDMAGEFGTDRMQKIKTAFQPEVSDAVNIMKPLYDYIQNFKLDRMKRTSDTVDAESIIDTIETMRGNACSLGLLFCHLAAKSGMDPMLIIGDDTCYVGTAVSKHAFNRTDYDSYAIDIDLTSSVPVRSRYSGKAFLFDVSERSSFSASVSSAYKYLRSNGIGSNCCLVSYEKERIKKIGMTFTKMEEVDE